MIVNATHRVNSLFVSTKQEETNLRNIVSDNGQVFVNQILSHGNGPFEIDQLFHDFINLTSDGTNLVYDLTGVDDLIFSNIITKAFSYVKSLTIQNFSEDDLILATNDPLFFSAPFGYPSNDITISQHSILHVDNYTTGWEVQTTQDRYIEFINSNGQELNFKFLVTGIRA